jgi:hypothetical protein
MFHLTPFVQWLVKRKQSDHDFILQQRRPFPPQVPLPNFVTDCPVAMRYHKLLSPLNWANFPERDPHQPWPGVDQTPRAPYAAAFLVKLDQGLRSLGALRFYLIDHPALLWLCGFPLFPSPTPWGFNAEISLPCQRQFGRILRTMPNPSLQFLLDETVRLIQKQLPAHIHVSDEVSLDIKLILAWVKENNPKQFVADRFNKEKQPKGDRDCKLGCKERTNQRKSSPNPSPSTPTTNPVPADTVSVGVFYWGYASGIVATRVPSQQLGDLISRIQ